MAIESIGEPVFLSGPAGPASAARVTALIDVVDAVKAVLTATDLPSARGALGLGNVANLAPADLPISSATATALADLASLVSANGASLSAILGGANPAVDTFIEAYTRFLSDESAAAALTATVGVLQTALSAEVTRATAAEGANASAVAAEVTRAQAAEAANATAIGNETTRAAGVETTLALKARQILTPGSGALTGGGDLSADRSLSIAANGVSNAMLAQAPTLTLKANLLGSTANVTDQTLSAILDAAIGATRGTILVRGSSGWSPVALGTSGYTLQSNGTDLVYAAASPGAGAVRNDAAQNPSATQIAQALANVGALIGPQGRLTLATGTPVMTAPVSAAATVYYTPDRGNLALVGTGLSTSPVPVVFAEVSQTLSDAAKSPVAAAAGQVYDCFSWMDGATYRVTRGPAWTAGATAGSNVARGSGDGSTALTRVAGILVNAVAIANGPAAGMGVYVGTIATDAGGATVSWNSGGVSAGGTAAVLNVWNAYNRRPVLALVGDTTTSWSYASTTMRPPNGSAGMRASFVTGLAEDPVEASYRIYADGGYCGVGLDASAYAGVTGVLASAGLMDGFHRTTALGRHYLTALEWTGGGTANYSGQYYSALRFTGWF